MATKVHMEALSPTMEEGRLVSWLKKEGEQVNEGDVLAEIETDKANMEMEALGSGVLRKILVPAGGKAPIGALIGVVNKKTVNPIHVSRVRFIGMHDKTDHFFIVIY